MAKMDKVVKEEHATGFHVAIERFKQRDDVITFHEFWYKEVLDNPLYHFKLLADSGWPIDPEKSATVPDKSLCHI